MALQMIRAARLLLTATTMAFVACNTPLDLPTDNQPKWTSVSVGLFHTCGVFDGNAYCFGDDRTGQLGAKSVGDSTCSANGLTNPCRPKPGRVAHSFAFVAAGRLATCGVAADGTWCWGSATIRPTRTDDPIRVTSKLFQALAPLGVQMCGLEQTGEVYCWPGDLTSSPPQLTLVNATIPLITLSGSFNHLCGLTSSGDAYCWGQNPHGELAVGDTLPRTAPTHVAGSLRFTSISAGFGRTCGIASDRHAYCSGTAFWTWTKQPDDSLNSIEFVRVPGSDEFATVSVGDAACAITTAGDAKCWGWNGNMLLGTGGAGGTPATPVPVSGNRRYHGIAVGAYHACAITVDGALYCWGFDHAGQLGSVGFPPTCTLSDEFYACTGIPLLVPRPVS